MPLLVVCFLLLTSACAKAPKEDAASQLPASQISQLPEDAALASFIGNGYEGAAQSFMSTRYGSVSVVIGKSYHSAMNVLCKEAYVQGGTRSRIAACQDKERGWFLAPDISQER